MESKRGSRSKKKNNKNNDNKRLRNAMKKPKNFSCESCGRICASVTLLQDHLRTHTGEKPFLCATCHKSFRSRHQLKVHSQLRAYACSACDKLFTQNANLQAHIRGVHMKIPYPPRIRNRNKKTVPLTEDRRIEQLKNGGVVKNRYDTMRHDKLIYYKDNFAERKSTEALEVGRVVGCNNDRVVKNETVMLEDDLIGDDEVERIDYFEEVEFKKQLEYKKDDMDDCKEEIEYLEDWEAFDDDIITGT